MMTYVHLVKNFENQTFSYMFICNLKSSCYNVYVGNLTQYNALQTRNTKSKLKNLGIGSIRRLLNTYIIYHIHPKTILQNPLYGLQKVVLTSCDHVKIHKLNYLPLV